jgi:hypothetical protein
VVGCQPYAPAVFTPRSIIVLILRGWVDPGHMELSDATEIMLTDSTGDRSRDLPTGSAIPNTVEGYQNYVYVVYCALYKINGTRRVDGCWLIVLSGLADRSF